MDNRPSRGRDNRAYVSDASRIDYNGYHPKEHHRARHDNNPRGISGTQHRSGMDFNGHTGRQAMYYPREGGNGRYSNTREPVVDYNRGHSPRRGMKTHSGEGPFEVHESGSGHCIDSKRRHNPRQDHGLPRKYPMDYNPQNESAGVHSSKGVTDKRDVRRKDKGNDNKIVELREAIRSNDARRVYITGNTEQPGASGRLQDQQFAVWLKEVDREYETRWLNVWNTQCVSVVSYFIGVVFFIVFFHIRNLPHLPFPVIGNLADWDPDVTPLIWWKQGPLLVELMWGYTHVRKTLLVIVSAGRLRSGTTRMSSRDLNETRMNSRSIRQCLGAGAILYHMFFGAWLGWANNAFTGYLISDMELVISGVVVYVVGELIGTFCTCYFIWKNTEETKVFRSVRLASEFFVWLGFGLVSMTLPSVLILFARFTFLTYFLHIPERPNCS